MTDFLKRLFPPKSTGPRSSRDHIYGLSTEELLERLPFEAFLVQGEISVDTVLALHRERPQTHAFIIGPPNDLGPFCAYIEEMQPPAKSFKLAEKLSYETWVANGLAMLEDEAADGDPDHPVHGEWPEVGYSGNGPTPPMGAYGMVPPEVVVALGPSPSDRWWETFAHVRFGGWNSCPQPEVHMMLHRRWAEKYGATLITLGPDVVQVAIAEPIATRDEAMEMAKIHQAYCSEFLQGAGTYEEIAAGILGAKSWYFWWD